MKLHSTLLAYATLMCATIAGLSGCGTGNKSENETSPITDFAFDINIKQASSDFRIDTDSESDGLTYYLTLSTDIQWPIKIGDLDITSLQNTILEKTFPKDKETSDIDKAISNFISDAATYSIGDEIECIDTIPSTADLSMAFESTVDGKFISITTDAVTYSINFTQYMGAAHPMYASTIFTYLLNEQKVIDADWMFTPGYEQKITKELYLSLAQKCGVTVEELLQNIQLTSIAKPDNIYVMNGQIVFQYNPYSILPFSFGSVEATLSPYEVEDILTPAAHEFLLK